MSDSMAHIVKADPSRDWYLVHTHMGREHVAALNLNRQGFATFLPTQLRSIRHGRKLKTVRAAYFPAYLFTTFDQNSDRWSPINNTFGVRRLVAFNDRPARVPSAIISELIVRSDEAGLVNAFPTLAMGDQVRINAGPFTGHLALIEQLPSQSRARVLIELMQQPIPVEIDRQYLELYKKV